MKPLHNSKATVATGFSLPFSGRRGFTITELLLVISIIAILASLLLPGLNNAKSRSQTISCLNNLKQLQLGWVLYADDHNDLLPPNNFVTEDSATALMETASWCPGNVRTDTNTANIERGAIFPYLKNTAIYHCPADRSRVETTNGVKGTQLRNRSYAMSPSMNCETTAAFIPIFKKSTEIVFPNASDAFVFIEVNEDSLTDAHFEIVPDQPKWKEIPSDRHNQAGNLSFADGHVERWKWASPKKNKFAYSLVADTDDLRDLKRLQSGLKKSN